MEFVGYTVGVTVTEGIKVEVFVGISEGVIAEVVMGIIVEVIIVAIEEVALVIVALGDTVLIKIKFATSTYVGALVYTYTY